MSVERRVCAAVAARRHYVMEHKTQPLDYHSAGRAGRVRPRAWLSHMVTAAVLCLSVLAVDRHLRHPPQMNTPNIRQVEVGLAIYGATCAIAVVARGGLTARDKMVVASCLFLFVVTGYVGTVMTRLIHN